MKRFTERRGDGVRYVEGRYEITCYPKNDNLSDIDKMAVRLCELEDKLESGRLVELPCKVGDIVYTVYLDDNNEFKIAETHCFGFNIKEGDMEIITGFCYPYDYGCDKFTDKAQAEAHLKELQRKWFKVKRKSSASA